MTSSATIKSKDYFIKNKIKTLKILSLMLQSGFRRLLPPQCDSVESRIPERAGGRNYPTNR